MKEYTITPINTGMVNSNKAIICITTAPISIMM